MKKWFSGLLLFSVTTVLFFGCGEDTPTEVTSEDLIKPTKDSLVVTDYTAGTTTATARLYFTGKNNEDNFAGYDLYNVNPSTATGATAADSKDTTAPFDGSLFFEVTITDIDSTQTWYVVAKNDDAEYSEPITFTYNARTLDKEGWELDAISTVQDGDGIDIDASPSSAIAITQNYRDTILNRHDEYDADIAFFIAGASSYTIAAIGGADIAVSSTLPADSDASWITSGNRTTSTYGESTSTTVYVKTETNQYAKINVEFLTVGATPNIRVSVYKPGDNLGVKIMKQAK